MTKKRKAPATKKTAQPPDYRAMLSKPTVSPDQLHASGVLSISRNSIYDACKSGEIECVRYGKRIVIPTAPIRRKLGIEA